MIQSLLSILLCLILVACAKAPVSVSTPNLPRPSTNQPDIPGLGLPEGSVIRNYVNIDSTGSSEPAELNAYLNNSIMNPSGLASDLANEKAAYGRFENAVCITTGYDDYASVRVETPNGCPTKGDTIPFRGGEKYGPGELVSTIVGSSASSGSLPITIQWPNSIGGTGSIDLGFNFRAGYTGKLPDSKNYTVAPKNFVGTVTFGEFNLINNFDDVVDEMCGTVKCTRIVIGLIKNFTRHLNPLARLGLFNPLCDALSLSENCSLSFFNSMSPTPNLGTEPLLMANLPRDHRHLNRDHFRDTMGRRVTMPAIGYALSATFKGDEASGFYTAGVGIYVALLPGPQKIRSACDLYYSNMNPSSPTYMQGGTYRITSVLGDTSSLNGIYVYGSDRTALTSSFEAPTFLLNPDLYVSTSNCTAIDDNDPLNQTL